MQLLQTVWQTLIHGHDCSVGRFVRFHFPAPIKETLLRVPPHSVGDEIVELAVHEVIVEL